MSADPMGWRKHLSSLLGTKPKAAPRKPVAKGAPSIKDSPRAKLIAQALQIHRTQGAAVRQTIAGAIADLQRAGAKTLRDPDALARMMSLIQAQRAMKRLMSGDLRRYLVLNGVRELLGGSTPSTPAKTTVVRR